MTKPPDPSRPTREEWQLFKDRRLSESQSLRIEAYIAEHGLPAEMAGIHSNSSHDALKYDLHRLDAGDPESKVGIEALKHDASRDVKNLIEIYPELGSSLNSGSSIEESQIGHYRILENVSRSRMGRVYRALDQRTGATVAMKFPPDVLNERTIDRFRREIELTRRLNHPQIVTVVDELQFRGMPVYVMPWVEGIDLALVLRTAGRLSESDTAAVGAAVARVLKHLADTGVAHRDIKPSNLMLTKTGYVVLIDLGLALLNNSEVTDETFTESIQIIGTMDYIAPEQARDAHAADFRADIYSLGCTLCKLATGKAPFENANERHAMQKIMAHSLDPFPDLHEKFVSVQPSAVDIARFSFSGFFLEL